MNTVIVTPTRRNAYVEYRERLAHEACFEQQVRMAEAQQRQFEHMVTKSLAENPSFDFNTGLLLA